MIKRINKISCSLLVVFLLTGCWDVEEIENRGFIMGMAIDLAEEGKVNGNYQLTLTSQFAVPPGLGTPSQGGGGGEKAYMNLSASGDSVYAIAQNLADQTNKLPFFEHLKVIIISEEVAAIPQLFGNVMDVYIRNRDTRRGIKVIIAKGKAKDILNIQPENEKLPSRYIDQLLDNSLKKTGNMRPVRVGDINEYLLTKSDFILSEVKADQTRLTFEGGSVYNSNANRVIGSLNLKEMLGFQLITGQRVQGPIVVNFRDHLTTYSIREASSKIKIKTSDPNNIAIDVTIELEGEMQETFGTVILQEEGVIQELEKEVSKKVKEIANKTIVKAQQELQTDVFDFGGRIKKFHYDTWVKIKEEWEQGEKYFEKSNINVTVKAEVRADGVVKKSKK